MIFMADQFIPSENEIVAIKEGNIPEKVIDEGDSLSIGCTIHSFYWPYDISVPPKKDDYEPVAFCKGDNTCLTRFHYRGIILWQGFTLRRNKPVVYFRNLGHTPLLCSKQQITYATPDNIKDRWILTEYLIRKLQTMRSEKQDEYKITSYSQKLVSEPVPEQSKFTWERIKYYVLVTPVQRIDELKINQLLKDRLLSL